MSSHVINISQDYIHYLYAVLTEPSIAMIVLNPGIPWTRFSMQINFALFAQRLL